MNDLEKMIGNTALVSDNFTFSMDRQTGGSMIMAKGAGREISPHFLLQAFTRDVSAKDMWEISNMVCDYFNSVDFYDDDEIEEE
jgi:hypothetical protein